MSDQALAQILQVCRSLEEAAAQGYLAFVQALEDPAHKRFWAEVAADESRHVQYWDRLIEMHKNGQLPRLFDNPQPILDELMATQKDFDVLLKAWAAGANPRTAIRIALRMEAGMLSPTFALFFRKIEQDQGKTTPGQDYTEHLLKFRQHMRQVDPENEEWHLLGKTLSVMWAHNQQLAEYFVQLKTLQGLIPICASCKKIRDTAGAWQPLEIYIGKHSEAQFSHGLCPDCQHKLYPEIFQQQGI